MESEGFDCGTGGNFAIHDILFGDCLRDLAWEAKPDKSLAQCLPSEEKAWLGKSNKTAEAHRISGNTRFGKQQYMAALVYYNLVSGPHQRQHASKHSSRRLVRRKRAAKATQPSHRLT